MEAIKATGDKNIVSKTAQINQQSTLEATGKKIDNAINEQAKTDQLNSINNNRDRDLKSFNTTAKGIALNNNIQALEKQKNQLENDLAKENLTIGAGFGFGINEEATKKELQNVQEKLSQAKQSYDEVFSQYQVKQNQVSTISDKSAVNKIISTTSSMDALSFASSSAKFEGMQSIGAITQTGGLTPQARMGEIFSGQEAGKALIGKGIAFNDAQVLNQVLNASGIKGIQADKIRDAQKSGNFKEASRLFHQATIGTQLQGYGSYGAFNLGITPNRKDIMGSVSSALSISGGVTANMGNVSSTLAYQLGGIEGARTLAGAEAGMNAGLSTIETILPSGRIGKAVRGVKKVFGRGNQKGGNGGDGSMSNKGIN